jgi:hypothetical protein
MHRSRRRTNYLADLTDYLGYRKGGEFTDLFKTINPYVGAALAVGCYLGLMILGKREGARFIYFQFRLTIVDPFLRRLERKSTILEFRCENAL